MVDVLLAHSYFLKYDPKQLQKMRPYAPLAALYAAGILRAQGYSVALFDAMLSDGEAEFEAALARHQPRYAVLYEDNFNFLSKMCLTRMRDAACTMSAMARERGATVIATGADASDHPEHYLAHGVQYVMVGEADHTLAELLAALEAAAPPAAISGIAGLALADPRAPGGVYRSPRRSPERHPDVFPFPAWDLLDVERYRAAWQQAHGFYSLNLVSTRGCPFHCNWCAKPIWGQRYAMRSPANMADELALVKQTLRPDHIWFADDIFGLRPQWVAAFGREVAARDAALPFMIQSRVDLMTDQAVPGLKQAGCDEVWMGAESGSQKVLDAMDKGTRVDEIYAARARLRAAAIKACFFIQLGYPGETFDDIMLTVQLVRDTLPDNIGVSVSYPLPGTKFYDMVRAELGEKTHWTDSDDLAMMFQGAYRSPFYRRLHTLLHDDLDLHRALAGLGEHPAADGLPAALSRLSAEWFALGQIEAEHRNQAPTLLVRQNGHMPVPDLSKEWN
ncbi:MAG: B12-binding domain-containing radical SAM protein [Kouleothrix sp.]|jgi:anaerobic magnesium-protoporphyrin IX monomethyl ester cyclase|nr:B12-binding domain-containing radical SAM protein [Kouleothrix sp.]